MRNSAMRIIASLAAFLLLAGPGARAQAPDSVVRKDLPKLEIPEITIVGKKAITLPFARKGEIYDVPVYDAPAPDSSLLTDRPPIELPAGSLPRYEQREMPWRVSAEGSAGNFGTFGFRGYVDYHTQRWNLSTIGGYRRTDGDAPNTAGDEFQLGGKYTALVTTDNDILRNFRLNGDLEFKHDAFGMPGVPAAGTKRGRDLYTFGAGFASVRRDGLVIDFSVAGDVLSVNDAAGGTDSGVTVTSPALNASVTGDVGDYRIISGFRYVSSSLDYPNSVPSPSLFTLLAAVQWRISPAFFLKAGGEYSGGSGTDDVSRSSFAPLAELEWQINAGRKVNLWFRPGMTLTPYSELAAKVPFLAREIMMVPEDRTVDAGGSIWYNSGMLTLELTGDYSRSDNRPLIVTDSGRIRAEFAGTWQSELRVDGTLRPDPGFRVRFNGALRPSRERGGSSQLPMTPLTGAGAQAEYDITAWWTLSAAARYWGKQNTDRGGSASIAGALVLDAGAETTLIPRVLLSGGVRNLLDKQYQWWSGYPAPGAEFYVTAKATL
jgi:hypothetical protein